MSLPNRRSVPLRPLVLSAGVLLASMSAWAIVTDLANVANVHAPAGEHIDQADLNALPVSERFTEPDQTRLVDDVCRNGGTRTVVLETKA